MKTGIEYGQVAWNPVTGCTKISEACQNCWAERMAKRMAGRCGYDKDEPFKVTLHPDRLQDPLKWKKPRTVLVSFMGDLFHDDVQDDWILAAFTAMGLTYQHTGKMKEVSPGHKVAIHAPKHTFMLLTKRPQRMKSFIDRLYSQEPDEEWEKRIRHYAFCLSAMHRDILPGNAFLTVYAWLNDGMPGLWLGVTAENQARADERIPVLLQIPAAKRFVSIEPMLGPVDLSNLKYDGDVLDALVGEYLSTDGSEAYVPWDKLDWVICGSESGPRKRPAQTEWICDLKDKCVAAAVPFYLKQMEVDGKLVKLPKLDGQEWQQMPERVTL